MTAPYSSDHDITNRSERIRAEEERRAALPVFAVIEEKIKKAGVPYNVDVQTLLLYDIALSLREANEIARAGLEFSRGLATKFD